LFVVVVVVVVVGVAVSLCSAMCASAFSSGWMEAERDAIPSPPCLWFTTNHPFLDSLSFFPPDPQTVGLPLSVFYIMFRHMCLARTRTRTALLCAMFPSLPLRNLCITYGVVALAMELSRHGCFVCLI
jgi:hypothetical protein